MSKGPGKWQSAVLAITVGPVAGWHSVEDVAVSVGVIRNEEESTLSRSDREAIRRAVRILADRRAVDCAHVGGELMVGPPGASAALREMCDLLDDVATGRLSVDAAVERSWSP